MPQKRKAKAFVAEVNSLSKTPQSPDLGENAHVLASLQQTLADSDNATIDPQLATPVETTATTSSTQSAAADSDQLQRQLEAKHQIQLEQIQVTATEGIEALRVESNSQIAEITSTYQGQIEALTQQLQEADQRTERLEGLYRLTGSSIPVTEAQAVNEPGQTVQVNTLVGSLSDKPLGAYKEALQVLDGSDKISKFGPRRGEFFAYDTREMRRFIRANKHQLIQDMEVWGKHNGLFRGSNQRVSKQAATTRVDIDGGFLATLSGIMRETNRPGYIFWQFLSVMIDFQKGLGDTMQLARSDFLPRAVSVDDRRLSGAGVFVNIDPGSQSLSVGTVPALLEEWGLGANATYAPVGVPTFVQAYSMIDLITILQENLLEDYWSWEDLASRSLWMPTSRVVYNNGTQVTTNPADVIAGGDGMFTENYANNLNAYARSQQIKPLIDGCYGMALPTQAATSYKNSLSINNRWQAPNETSLRELLNILNPEQIGEIGRITGYLGKWSNFHMFETNAYGVGAPGTEGVQLEPLGVGPTLTRKSFLFGRNSIGRGVGTEMEIVMDDSGTFGRLQRYIWREESGFVAIDVDPTGYGQQPTDRGSQQLRVIAVHTTDVSV